MPSSETPILTLTSAWRSCRLLKPTETESSAPMQSESEARLPPEPRLAKRPILSSSGRKTPWSFFTRPPSISSFVILSSLPSETPLSAAYIALISVVFPVLFSPLMIFIFGDHLRLSLSNNIKLLSSKEDIFTGNTS